jgi:hypothetical protein
MSGGGNFSGGHGGHVGHMGGGHFNGGGHFGGGHFGGGHYYGGGWGGHYWHGGWGGPYVSFGVYAPFWDPWYYDPGYYPAYYGAGYDDAYVAGAASAYRQQAMQEAMAAPIGQSIDWTDGDASGTVTPVRNGHSGDRYCREFQQDIVVDGHHEQAYGAACQEPDGSWQIVPDNP